jgi:hypothetical protein
MIYDFLNSDENDFYKNFLDNEMNLQKEKEEYNKVLLKKIQDIEKQM